MEELELESAVIPTGIPGLDTILCGGFLKSGFYLVQGDPGSGKTTMALQYLLQCAERGETAMYIYAHGIPQ